MFINLTPPSLTKSLALKVLNSCHSERSEESVLSRSENGFFVVSLLRMTFEAKPLRREGGAGDGLVNTLSLTSVALFLKEVLEWH